jgi:hypothetical protein
MGFFKKIKRRVKKVAKAIVKVPTKAVKTVVKVAANTVQGGVKAAGQLAKGAVKGTTGLAKGVVGAAGSAVKGTVGAAGKLAQGKPLGALKSVGKGYAGAGKSLVSGVKSYATEPLKGIGRAGSTAFKTGTRNLKQTVAGGIGITKAATAPFRGGSSRRRSTQNDAAAFNSGLREQLSGIQGDGSTEDDEE